MGFFLVRAEQSNKAREVVASLEEKKRAETAPLEDQRHVTGDSDNFKKVCQVLAELRISTSPRERKNLERVLGAELARLSAEEAKPELKSQVERLEALTKVYLLL